MHVGLSGHPPFGLGMRLGEYSPSLSCHEPQLCEQLLPGEEPPDLHPILTYLNRNPNPKPGLSPIPSSNRNL